ncbi:MAG: hypothetical protein WCL16_10660, partial [bacterium]
LNGTDVYKKTYHAEFKILTLDDATMAFNILEVASDGTVHPGSTTYTLSRVAADYSESFKGVWYGKCTSAGSADTEYHYWEYLADGSYIYYYLDANKFWTKKSDNRGRYFLYGNLLASNYANDLISGGSGQAFECWNFSIAGNTMRWTGLRENNKTVTYEMQKVASAPATR